jgi:uncharacterized membrane protein YiaA
MLFASRQSSGGDPLYRWKALALVTGVGLFLVGVRLQQGWLTWVGMGFLGVALVLRVFGRTRKGDATRRPN